MQMMNPVHSRNPVIESRDLRLVDAVVRHGSLTRAARELHLTPSALSHRLTELERRLGLALFVRAGKRMVPTPAGERMQIGARELIAGLARVANQVRATGAQRRHIVRLSTECYTCYHWLPAVLREYTRAHSGSEVRIVADATRRPLPALLAGRLDVAIVSSPTRDRRIATTTLFEDELVAVVAPDHPWASKRWVEPADFAAERLITTSAPSESDLIRFVLEPAGIVPRETLEVQLTEATLELIKSGFGVAVLARWAAAPQVRARRLVARPVGRRGLRRVWKAAVLRHRSRAPEISAFITALRKWSGPSPQPE